MRVPLRPGERKSHPGGHPAGPGLRLPPHSAGSGQDSCPEGPARVPPPCPCRARGTPSWRGTHACPARGRPAVPRWSVPAAGSCRRLRGAVRRHPPPPQPPGRGRAAPAATRCAPACWHGTARLAGSPTDGTAAPPGPYIGGRCGEGAAADAPAPIGLGGRHRPVERSRPGPAATKGRGGQGGGCEPWTARGARPG